MVTAAAAAGPTPAQAAGSVVAHSPLVYQQLASGQIQMYQLPPGFVPVLVSNTGSLQPLVSIPPQQQQQQQQQPQPQPTEAAAVAAANTLSLPQDSSNASRRSSSTPMDQAGSVVMMQPQPQVMPYQPPQQPQPTVVMDAPGPEPFIEQAPVVPQEPSQQFVVTAPAATSEAVAPLPTGSEATFEYLTVEPDPASLNDNDKEDTSPSPQPLLEPDNASEAVGEADEDDSATTTTQGKDVSDMDLSHKHPKFVVMPCSSSSLYSSTSSLSSTFSCDSSLHAVKLHHQHSVNDMQQQNHREAAAQFRKSSVPVNQIQIHAEAFLRRGSLPIPSLLLAATAASTNDIHKFNTSRRSSSGTVMPIPLATLKENHGDSDISLEDLSQVSQIKPILSSSITFWNLG